MSVGALMMDVIAMKMNVIVLVSAMIVILWMRSNDDNGYF